MVRQLEASGAYRVLRRLTPQAPSADPEQSNERIGLVLDVETLDLNPVKDEVIELGMVKFAYSEQDEVTRIVGEFRAFHQPSIPIPADITESTGITDMIVAGHTIDATQVEAFAADANIVIAHNANFDRRFAERFWPAFQHKPFTCAARSAARSRWSRSWPRPRNTTHAVRERTQRAGWLASPGFPTTEPMRVAIVFNSLSHTPNALRHRPHKAAMPDSMHAYTFVSLLGRLWGRRLSGRPQPTHSLQPMTYQQLF